MQVVVVSFLRCSLSLMSTFVVVTIVVIIVVASEVLLSFCLEPPYGDVSTGVKHPGQVDGKGGLGLRGIAFTAVLAVLTVLAVLERSLPCFCLSYKIQCQETTVTVLAVSAVSVVTAYPPPLNSTPLFRHPDLFRERALG